MDTRPGHAYIAPTPTDSRSPCPALNAAANHGYLPHSGKNLSFLQLVRCVRDLYRLSYPLAVLLALGGILLCGNVWTFKLDLVDLAKHNRIEHDASLAHRDARDGDNLHVDPRLVTALEAESSDGRDLTLADFARIRAKKEMALPTGKLDSLHGGFAGGECIFTVQIMGDGQEVSLATVKQWFGEERIPTGWMPRITLGLLQVFPQVRMFRGMVAKARKGE